MRRTSLFVGGELRAAHQVAEADQTVQVTG
jgi:hypothetical protein